MLRLVRSAINTSAKMANPLRNAVVKREFTRNLVVLSRTPENLNLSSAVSSLQNPSNLCACGCGIRGVHTKSERELVEFLTEEIVAERKAQKVKTIPAEVDGFKVKLDGAEIELSKKSDKEEVVISFNVNHTVDTEDEPEVDPNAEKADFGQMKSKPTFEVDVVRGDLTLSFTCSFLSGQPNEGEYDDVFGIDEVTLYRGEWNDKTYAVAGDVLDGYLYDLLMNLLEEKGISNEFVEKLSDFATLYEHSAYIGLLEGLSKFTVGK